MSVRLMAMIYETRFGDMDYETDQKKYTITGSTLKSVALALADHANDDGKGAYPSITRLELKTEFSRPTIIRSLAAMQQRGIIKYSGISDRGTNDYTFNINKITEMCKASDLEVVKPLHQGSEATSPEVVKPLHQDSEATSPKPSFNHPLNHPLINCASAKKTAEAPRTRAIKKGDGVDMLLDFMKKPGEKDLSYFPEDVVPVLEKFLALFPVDVPRMPPNRRGAYAQWINECRLLAVACAEVGLNAIDLVYTDCSSLTISHPGALINMVKAQVGKMRVRQAKPAIYDQSEIYAFQAALDKRRATA